MYYKNYKLYFRTIGIALALVISGALCGSGILQAKENVNANAITFPDLAVNQYTIHKGEESRIAAYYQGKQVTPEQAIWESDNEGIVKVNQKGVVQGIEEGMATIRVTLTSDGSVSANLRINVGKPVNQITCDIESVILEKGMSHTIKTKIKPANAENKKIGYRSMNPSVARVNASGRITARKGGSTRILVYSKDGRSQTYITVTVQNSCAEYTMAKGKSKSITDVLAKNPSVENSNAKKYKWRSRSPKIIKIEKNQTFRALKKGKAYIEGRPKNKKDNKVLLKITVGNPSKNVKVASGSYIKNVGQRIRLSAKIKPTSATNKKLVYISENPEVATVTASGRVVCLSPGKTNIQVYAKDSCSKTTVSVVVKVPLKRTTTYGMVEGTFIKNGTEVAAWLGVPYAKPPVGELRWKAPRDPEPWAGVLATKQYANKAAQIGAGGVLEGSEDCLYLNVYRPNSGETNLPVMVFIHGGGNVSGNSHKNLKNLCVAANSVIVSVEFRLGALGWMSLPVLQTGDKEEDSGNFALLDIKKSLEWVRDNIAEFGGNNANVTLAGYSAGGRNVLACLISPIMDGLYHKMVSLSGGMNTVTPEEGKDSAYGKFAKILVNKGRFSTKKEALSWLEKTATKEEIIGFLYSLSTYELANMYKYTGLRLSNSPQLFTDGHVLPEEGFQAVRNGKYNQVPVILGSSSKEFATYALSAEYTESMDVINAIHTGWNMFDMILAAKEYGSMLQTGQYIERNAEALLSNAGQPNIYAYRFNWGNNANVTGDFYSRFLGSYHGVDVQFLCGTWTNAYLGYVPDLYNSSNLQGRKALSANMQQYIGNFLRTGNPNGNGLKKWNPWNGVAGQDKVMVFNAGNKKDTSKMSSEYITQEGVYNQMKENLTSNQYHMLMGYIFKGRCFMPVQEYVTKKEEDILSTEDNENLTEDIFNTDE